MMESFGVNLQRKNLYNAYYDAIKQMEKGIKDRGTNEKALTQKAGQAADKMKKIM